MDSNAYGMGVMYAIGMMFANRTLNMDADFKENLHPRDKNGKFTRKGMGVAGKQQSSSESSVNAGNPEKGSKIGNLGNRNEGSRNEGRESVGAEHEFRSLQEGSRKLSPEDVRLFHRGDKVVDEGLRGRLAEVLGRRLEAKCGGMRNGQRVLKNPKTGEDARFYEGVSAQDFHDCFEIVQKFLRNGDAVDVHDAKDYEDCENYLSDDGLSGFSITKDGDLISVFSLGKSGFLRTISPVVGEKAKTLDCFASHKQPLPEMYAKAFGFKTASVLDFNYDILAQYSGKDYADYFVETYGEAPVAFMVNTDADVETKHFDKDDYDGAKAYQMSFFSKN